MKNIKLNPMQWILVGSMCICLLFALIASGYLHDYWTEQDTDNRTRNWSEWEDGAFYGFCAAKETKATYSNYLLKAHEIKKYSMERAKAKENELNKLRAYKEE
jgi:hypothetical protein